MEISVNDYVEEKECVYKDRKYSVRDNGAILRHPREDKTRVNKNDNVWSFGKPNNKNGYLYLGSVRIHRIVATAFHGEPPTQEHVVDHIDTNRQNNRPENLRWLTRLENALKNPATRKKIEYLCGSIEAFLENPSMLNDLQGDPNFAWMRRVTTEEAQNCMMRMSLWASSSNKPASSRGAINSKSSFGKRVYKPLQKWEVGLAGEPGLELALTPWCAQYMWRAAAYFPCCPQNIGIDPLGDYFQNLEVGAVLAYSDCDDVCPRLTVFESIILRDRSSIVVMSKRIDGKWSIIGIKLDEKSKHFIHFKLGTYPSKDEADKAFCVKKELKKFWADGYANA